MSKVLGPLFSLSASKKFGKTIVYQRGRGGHRAFKRTVPYDPKSDSQLAMRDYFGEARASWSDLTKGEQSEWNQFVFR